ncbi:MAG TPA: cyclic nucleotide-binding domain-containing protein [Candidatus Limnocylindria bacterium]|nr:cyclic nucleotide-binding domain-containing protein [Candidatus Limnocylindria bacterium]
MADEKLEQLRRVPLFSGLGKRELEQLGTLADEIDVADGRVLTREGETGHEFFVVLDGTVRVDVGSSVVATLGKGDFLGEIALVDGKPRTATTRAVGATRLLVIGHREFHQLMDDFPTVKTSVLEALAERVRRNEQLG